MLRTVSSEERNATLRELCDAAGVTACARITHRVLAPDEVVHLTEGGTIDVGAHTATHSALSALPLTLQRSEIAGSKARLQEIAGREVAGFAYPFGGRSDYTAATVALVREAGFTSACSTHRGLVGPRSDQFRLPRMLVRNWDPETFAGQMREWLGDEEVSCS